MKTLMVKEIIKSSMADDADKGGFVFQKILEHSKKDSEIVLDFREIEFASIAFLNNALGRIFDKSVFDSEKCNVFVDNMDEMMQNSLKEAITTAVQRYQRF